VRQAMADTHLPVISRPASPEFPSVVRSRVPSQSATTCPPLAAPLGQSSSCPQLPAADAKTSNALRASCPQLPAAQGAAQRREEEERDFFARQLQHSSVQSRRQRSMIQREFVRKNRADDDAEFWGAKGKDGFRTYLKKKFGTILHGWRALDQDRCGRLSFQEFCQACRAMGYHGNFKKLWAELDEKKTGMVSLMEIDADVGHYIGTFKHALLQKYGDMVTAWFQCIDVKREGRIQERSLRTAVGTLGLDLNPAKLFSFLRSPSSQEGVTFQEFDPEAWKKYMSGDYSNLVLPDSREFLDDLPEAAGHMPESVTDRRQGGVEQMRRSMNKDAQDQRKQEHEQMDKFKVGLKSAGGFRQALAHRFGSLLGAWREALDYDGNNRLTFGEFCLALNRLGMHGEVRKLWCQLTKSTDESGFLVFRDLDPQTDTMLSELRKKLTQEYENMLMAWIKGLDTRGTGLVTEKQFVQCCRKIGFGGNARELFKRMQPDAGRTLMTIRDFDTKAFHALSRGDFRMLSEPAQGHHGKSPLELTFHQRNEAGFFYQIRRAADASRRKEFAKACRVAHPSAYSINTIEDFQDLCIRKYGSLIAAWRQCLDEHGNGKLTFGEFCDALRRLGYAGEFRSLFKEYDREQKGYICLADLDPEADVLVSDFLDLLGERFGTLDLAWRDGFHQDPHGSITKKDVMEACAALGYAHDAEKLYGCLQTSPGKQLITIWDIDPACSRSRKRGLEAIIPSAPRPLSPTARGNEAHTFFLEDGSPSSRTRNVMSKTFHTFNSPPLVQQLRRCLRARWGSTVAGWRLSLDPQLHGSCGFGMFMKALEECAFGGKPRALWDELSGEKNSITYMDLDEPAASLLNSFREQLVDRHGSIMDAWHELESAGRGLLDEETFVSVLTEMGITIKHPRKLFKLLLSRQGQRSLAKEGFQALLVGVVPTEQRDLWVSRKPRKESTHKGQASPKRKVSPSKASGATRLGKAGAAPAAPTAVIEEEAKQAPPAELDRSQAQPSRSERNDLKVNVVPPVGKPKAHDVQAAEPESRETAHSVATRAVSSTVSRVAAKLASEEAEQAPRAKVLDSAARKKAIGGLLKAAKTGHLEKSLRQFEEQEATAAAKELPKTLEELRRYLLEKYGSLEAAWRRGASTDSMTEADFEATLKKWELEEASTNFWQQLDVQRSGCITLQQLDAGTVVCPS